VSGPITAWSYSRLEIFERCPWRAKLQFVDKRDTEAAKAANAEAQAKGEAARLRGLEVHENAEKFVRGEIDELPKELKKNAKLFEETRAIMAEAPARVVLEEDWAFNKDWQPTEYYGTDAWCRMKLDRFVWHDDEKTAGELTDYKTGKKMGNEVKHGQQGQLFTIGSFMRYPSLQAIKVQFAYLDEGKMSLPKTYSREQAMAFLPSFDRRGRAMTEATVFPPKPNRINCAWCPFGPSRGDGSCHYGVEA
jgi:hypothetical protein